MSRTLVCHVSVMYHVSYISCGAGLFYVGLFYVPFLLSIPYPHTHVVYPSYRSPYSPIYHIPSILSHTYHYDRLISTQGDGWDDGYGSMDLACRWRC